METKSIDTLTAAPYNPRILDKHDGKSLERSIKRWGDISGITKNITTGYTVTGHQRIAILKENFGDRVKIIITGKHEQPDEHGTVATGLVVVEGTNIKLNYREVQWDEGEEKAANIAANRIQGSFDLDLLGQVNYEISQLENNSDLLEATGQTERELDAMLKRTGAIDSEPEQKNNDPDKLEFYLTNEQREIVEEALGHIKATRELQATQSPSLNGAALFTMCSDYLNKLHGVELETPTA